jgi:hypothetical protein
MDDIATARTADVNGTHDASVSETAAIGNVATTRDLGRNQPQGDDKIVPFATGGRLARSAIARSSRTTARAKRRVAQAPLPRLLPSLGAVLCALDLVLMGAAQALVFSIIGERLALGGGLEIFLVIALSVLTATTIFYASGCYQPHALVDSAVASARVPVALGLGCGVLFLELHYGLAALFPSAPVFLSISRCVTIVLLAAGISLCAAILARVLFYAMVHRHWFRRRVLVVGTGQRALRLRQLLTQDAHGIGNDLHFVSEAIIGGKVQDPPAELVNAVAIGELSIDQLAYKLVVSAPSKCPGSSIRMAFGCMPSIS